jgi:phage shock protein PspC (stress-responsive transcriptional regulator)
MDDTTEYNPTPSTSSAGPATAQPPTGSRAPSAASSAQPSAGSPAPSAASSARPSTGPAVAAAGGPTGGWSAPPTSGSAPEQPAITPPGPAEPTGGQSSAGEQAPPRNDRWSAKLERPHEGRVLGGVCAGMAEAWRVDPLALRIAFLAATLLLFPAGALLYLACWILMPDADDE